MTIPVPRHAPAGVLLLSITGFPVVGGKAQLTVAPEKPDAFIAAARSAGLTHSGRKGCFLVQGNDRVGAAHDIFKRLADAKTGCVPTYAKRAVSIGIGSRR